MEIEMGQRYRAWWTAFYRDSPPVMSINIDAQEPNLCGTPREIKAAVDAFQERVGTPVIGFVMRDELGEEYSYGELAVAVEEA